MEPNDLGVLPCSPHQLLNLHTVETFTAYGTQSPWGYEVYFSVASAGLNVPE